MRREDTSSPPDPAAPDRRLGPERRLRRRKDFSKLLSGGVRLNGRAATVVVRPNGARQPRLGLAVGRRVARRATTRHRLKRHVRESFRLVADHLGGLDVLVLVKPDADRMDARRFRELLAGQWRRAAGLAADGWPLVKNNAGTPVNRGA